MDSPSILYATRWLIRDTFCQALASRVFWPMLGASALVILFCLGVDMEGPRTLNAEGDTELYGADNRPLTDASPPAGHMTLLFGAFRLELFRDVVSQVHFLQGLFASWVAGVAGLLLALMWMAGFLPEALQANVAAVQMTRPVPLWLFLGGKYLGVIAFVGFQATIFFVGTWLALGLKTGIWLPAYLAGIPLLILHFASFHCVSVFLATVTRSTMACAFGSTLFWVLCLGVNYGRFAAVALPVMAPAVPPLPAAISAFIGLAYWLLPKPADFLLANEQLLNLGYHQATLSSMPEFRAALELAPLDPLLVLAATLGFIMAMLALGSWQLSKNEY